MMRLVIVAAVVIAGVLAHEEHSPLKSAYNQAAISKLSYSSPGANQPFPLYHPPSSPYYYQTYGYQPQYYYYYPSADANVASPSEKKYVQQGYPYYPSYYYFPSPPEGKPVEPTPGDSTADPSSTTPSPADDVTVDHSASPPKPGNGLYQPFKTYQHFPYYYLPAQKPSAESSSAQQPENPSQQKYSFSYTYPYFTAQYDANKPVSDYQYKFNYASAYPAYNYYQPAAYGYQFYQPSAKPTSEQQQTEN